MPVIKVIGISKQFQEKNKKFWALKEINLQIEKGIIFGLLGPNGAGKSTLIHILTNVLSPTSGKAIILGKEVSKNPKVLEKVGFMSSDSYFHWSLRVRDILNFYGRLYGVKKTTLTKRREELIKKFDLEKISEKPFHVLSTGERIRLLFAKALLHQPKILLLDEPTASLDPEMALKVRTTIKQLKKEGLTILLTSHNMQEVEELADEIGFIHQGQIVDLGSVTKVKLKHFSTYDVYFKVKELKNKPLLLKKGFSVNGRTLKKVLKAEENLSTWLSFLHQQEIIIEQVETKKPSLEDYFIKIAKTPLSK